MKKILSLLTLTLSSNAFAQFGPHWERPIETARMVVESATGELAPILQTMIVVNKRDGQVNPTSLSLKYATTNNVAIEENPQAIYRTLEVKNIEVDFCGSVTITAQKRYPLKRIRETLVLIDHRNRLLSDYCGPDHYVYPAWTAHYSVQRRNHGHLHSSNLMLTADEIPYGVITVQAP